MKWLRSIGAAALIALALLAVPGAGPALAAAPSVVIDSPVADSTQLSAFTVSGSATQSGNEATILSMKVKLTDDDGWLPPVEHNYAHGGTANSAIFSGSGATVNYDWANIAPKYNGPYTVTVTAVGQYRTALSGYQQQSTTVSKSFHVEIAPSKPTGVSASKPEDSSVVTIKWNKNPEPDIAGYVIYRSYAGDAGKDVGAVDGTKTSWTDDLAGKAPGQYKYAVQAVRHVRSCKSTSNTAEACSRIKAGDRSAYSSAVTVRATAPTTTTTTIKKSTGGGGGSTGGGSTGGGSTGGGSTGGGSTGGGSTSGSNAAGIRRGTGGGGFAPGGEVDLSQFGSLLNPKARGTGSGARPGDPDGPYDPSLPYGERAAESEEDDDSLVTIGGTSIPKPSDDWVKFIGAGSLATALLVHVLWFKQQVDSIPLETISE